VPPPSSKSFQVRPPAEALVHECTARGRRPGIYIFVVAPARKIDIPIVQVQRHVTGCVRQVPSDDAACVMSSLGDRGHIEQLAGVIIHPTEHDQRS